MGSGSYIDHDRFVMKNRLLASADEMGRRDAALEKKGFARVDRQKEASCYNCKSKKKCAEFRTKRTGGTTGAVSFGGDERMVCDKFEPAPAENRGMSKTQIKSLLKNVKKGY